MCHLMLGKGSKSGSVADTAPTLEIDSLMGGLPVSSGLDLNSFLRQLIALGGHIQWPHDSARGAPGQVEAVDPAITPHSVKFSLGSTRV